MMGGPVSASALLSVALRLPFGLGGLAILTNPRLCVPCRWHRPFPRAGGPVTSLAKYEAMRQQVAECARVDEAAQLWDKAAAMVAYARQRHDRELEGWVAEIKCRAVIRCGELSAELEKAEARGRGPVSLPTGGKRKQDVLAEAGISTRQLRLSADF